LHDWFGPLKKILDSVVGNATLTITGLEPKGDDGIVVTAVTSTTGASNSCCRASTSTCCGVSGPYGTARVTIIAAQPICE
jgi:hypothetical protein